MPFEARHSLHGRTEDMYQYTDFDKAFVKQRADQFRDQLERWQAGKLPEDDFRPLRLQNGWYVQRYAPMLRVAVPYGEINSAQIRVLAKVAREYDEPEAAVFQAALDGQGKMGTTYLPKNCAHFTTRTNVQFNWIPLSRAADVMDLLASVNLHGIQTSGNCIRNTTTDALAGIALTKPLTPAPTQKFCASGPRCTPSSPFCHASSRSPSLVPRKTAPPQAGTMWACTWSKMKRAKSASRYLSVAAWAARP